MLSAIPRLSASRRNLSNADRRASRSLSRLSEIPLSTMFAEDLVGSFSTRPKGECLTPRKPPSPSSPQVPFPVGYISETLAGTALLTLPCKCDTQDPQLGRPARGCRCPLFQPVMHWYASWRPSASQMDRIGMNLSIMLAMRGNNSQISIPGTLVLIGLKSPRISTGEYGLRSQRSICEGPPGM